MQGLDGDRLQVNRDSLGGISIILEPHAALLLHGCMIGAVDSASIVGELDVDTGPKQVNCGLAVDGHACHLRGTPKIPQAPHVWTFTPRPQKLILREKLIMHRLTNNPMA